MARKVHITLVDDLTGAPADETVQFAIDGLAYEIDLTEGNAQALRDALGKFVSAGRKLSRKEAAQRLASTKTRTQIGPDPKAVRAWAHANNIAVPDRGRVPASVTAQFLDAN